MTRFLRPRQIVTVLLFVIVPVLLVACSGNYPNSTFQPTTDFNRDSTSIWNQMMGWGFLVFVVVEAILVYTIIRYRRRPNTPEPEQVHGNTALELTWTILPAVILVFIMVPTVRTIWKWQTDIPANALQVEVTGHQWWWEFKYPQYGITTANELYMPIGRPVKFSLRTADVIHSFWMPGLGGKRDAISNRTNTLWFTPDSTGVNGWVGSCNEFCGASHANMRFRAFTVAEADFESWAAHQATPAVFRAPLPAPPTAATPAANTIGATAATPAVSAAPAPASTGYTFPRDQIPVHVMPQTPVPAGVDFPDGLTGDPIAGVALYSRSACIGCHKIEGNPMSVGIIGPNLTHVGSRHTIAGGLFPNDPKHMALWIKNARIMKPGVTMNTQGKDQFDPIMKMKVTAGGLTDQQIADIVAYLESLK